MLTNGGPLDSQSGSVAVARTFSVVSTGPSDLQNARPEPLSKFFPESALVILGEPGAGKTTAFRDAAGSEAGAAFVSVRDFLTLRPDRWAGRTLYLDGLDELRARTADGAAVLDQLRARLDDIGCPRFRLSCRAADWYGSSDLARLSMVAPDDRIVVLRIDPLTDVDIVAIAQAWLSDPHAFIEQAMTRGVHELLRNPLTLQMLLEVVRDGPWPATRTDLYARAVALLARERNEEHGRFQAPTVTFDAVLHAAQSICAVILCGGAKGVALTDVAASPDFPFLGQFPGPLNALATAARSRVFVGDGEERIVPLHRTVAEYLSASYLTARVTDGLPLGRVLSVLTGYDDKPVADLRGVFAWLASLDEEHARALIGRDPLAVVLYGDAGNLAPSDRLFVLQRLGELAKDDPWFRAGSWHTPTLGGLASSEMVEPFKAVLEDPTAPLSLTASVLEAVRYGRPLLELKATLVSIIRDHTRDGSLRVESLQALLHLGRGDITFLVSLLEDIHQGLVVDNERRLRGVLLDVLYPVAVSPEKVVRYLIPPSPHLVGEYTMFVEHELLRVTESEAIPPLLDAVARRPPLRRRDDFLGFVGTLLLRGLTEHGHVVTAARLWTWLGVSLGEHEELRLGNKDQDAIREWFSKYPVKCRELYEHWLILHPSSELQRQHWTFWRRLNHARPGPGFGEWLLELAAEEPDEIRSDFIFREAVRDLLAWIPTDRNSPKI